MDYVERKLELLGVVVQKCFVGATDLAQRVVIILTDVFLILFAAVAGSKDWGHHCDQNLHLYGFACVILCMLDMAWEFVRCSLESSLDRLQKDFSHDGSPRLGGNTEEGLLGGGGGYNDGVVGSPAVNALESSPARGGSLSGGAVGQGVRREKAMRRKRMSDLQFWSIVFTVSVAIIFSFFSAHDEECKELMPNLYAYVHDFTYIFVFRLGAILLSVCCRTVKDYEDAAHAAGGLPGDRRSPTVEMSGGM